MSTKCSILLSMDQPRWLTPSQERAWRGYRRMRARLDLQINRDLAEDSGLSEADYDVLSNLSEAVDHRWRLRDLSAHMLWTQSRLSHHIARMEQRALVTREQDPSDGRGAIVALTEEGWRTIVEAAPAHVESVRRHLIDLLTDEQIDTLGSIAETVLRHICETEAG